MSDSKTETFVHPDRLRIRGGLQAARFLAATAIAIGCLAEIGWWLGIEMLTRVIAGLPTLKPLTGVCVILNGASVAMLARRSATENPTEPQKRTAMRAAVLLLSTVVICITSLTLLEYRARIFAGFDRSLFPSRILAEAIPFPGRMSIATAFAHLFVAISTFLLAVQQGRVRAWHQFSCLVPIGFGLVGVLGFAYGSGAENAFTPFDTMAVHSAAICFLLGVSLLLVRPDVGIMADFNSPHLGGFLARRTLPIAMTLPFFLGWLRLRGQRAGYYGTEFGLAIFACTCTMLFGILIWWTARELNRVDDERIQAGNFETKRSGILEEIAAGRPMPMILESIVALVESRAPEARCSILFYEKEGGRLLDGAGAKLPREYRDKIHGIIAGPEVGSCGTAAFLGKRVIVEDIATHPYWIPWRDFALGFGLRSCWSSPILSASGGVLGTFAVYGDRVRAPKPQELAWVAAATDLASIAIERRNAEEALRTSEAQLRFLFENAGLGMAMATIGGKLVKCNPAFSAMLGYSETEFLQLESTKLTFPEDLTADRTRFDALRSGEAASVQYMKRYIHKTGRIVYANLNVSVVKSEQGVPLYVVGIVEDITARHVAEAENARVQAHAEQAQRLQALGTLAGGIAHDFNNILTSIVGNVEFAGKATGSNHAAKPHLDRIAEAASRATDLVGQILAFGRLQTAERAPLRLQPIIEEVLNLLRATLPAKIVLQTAMDPAAPPVLADSTQMHQILMNLGTNAAQAMAQRGGVLHVALRVADLSEKQIGGLAGGRYVQLAVSDTGSGMSKETLAHLFEPFFTTKSQGEGTGLGLSVVHGIVTSYGGAIQVTSAPDAGASFDLYFPPAPAGVTTKAARIALERRGMGERILVIDDEVAVAEIAQYQLEQNGYRPAVFTNAASALEHFSGAPDSFDCVLTDLSMPGRSGLDVAKAIRELRPEIPIVLASGFLPTEEQEAAARLGINLFLAKPYRAAKLLDTIAKVFSREPAELPPAH